MGDVTREVNLDLVAKGDTESAAVVVPAAARSSVRRDGQRRADLFCQRGSL